MIEPRLVSKIISKEGAVIYETRPKEIINFTKPEQAYLMTDMLKDVIKRGTGKNAQVEGIELAGKTGTTNDNVDAWFCGYSPTIETIVWFGRDNNRRIGPRATGGALAAPAFAYYYDKLLKLYPKTPRIFERPEGVFEGSVDGMSELYTEISPLPKTAASIEEDELKRHERIVEDERYMVEEEDVDPTEPSSSDASRESLDEGPLIPDGRPEPRKSAEKSEDNFLDMFGETKKPVEENASSSEDSFFEEVITNEPISPPDSPKGPHIKADVEDDGTITLHPEVKVSTGTTRDQDIFVAGEGDQQERRLDPIEPSFDETKKNIIEPEPEDPLHPRAKPPVPTIDEDSGALF
jgi:membrane peptidoglycan carboxypeptidase